MLKKGILLTHRYLGVGLCLLFVVWFLSGFVMMYVRFPTMKHQERLERLPESEFRNCRVSLPEAWRLSGLSRPLKTARLGSLLGRPVYRLVSEDNHQCLVRADSGERLDGIGPATATQLVYAFLNNSERITRVEELAEIDQWMAGHKYQGYLPHVYRFEMTDGTYVYVSVHLGEVVQYVTREQRFWAWLGPIPHWLYPTFLIRNRPVWSQIVIWLSIAGSVMSLSGVIMGIIRVKRRRRKSRLDLSPYKKPWFRWHHYTGFVFGIFVFTWVLSGLFSMSPFNWAPSTKPTRTEAGNWSGGPPEAGDWELPPSAIGLIPGFRLKELSFVRLHGRPYYLAWEDEKNTRLIPADRIPVSVSTLLNWSSERDAVRRLRPDASVREIAVLTAYDDYYYSKHGEKRLPVLRVTFADEDETAYYIDLRTGQIALRHQSATRLERWLYHGLHSFDFHWLVYRQPLWDVVTGFLMAGGLAVSLTGLVLGWRWLRRKALKKRA